MGKRSRQQKRAVQQIARRSAADKFLGSDVVSRRGRVGSDSLFIGGKHLYNPKLVFSVPAWCKLQYFLHKADTEIGGYGRALDPANPLYINEFAVLKQSCTSATVEFDGEDVDDYFFKCKADGLLPGQFGNVWIHTHPSGMKANPSGTDENTFKSSFSGCDWSVMAIVAKDGDTYARLQYNLGPRMEGVIPMFVDWENWHKQVTGNTATTWQEEFTTKIHKKSFGYSSSGHSHATTASPAHNAWQQEHWKSQEADKLAVANKDVTFPPKDAWGCPPGPGFVKGTQTGTWKRPNSDLIWHHRGIRAGKDIFVIEKEKLIKTPLLEGVGDGVWVLEGGKQIWHPSPTASEANTKSSEPATSADSIQEDIHKEVKAFINSAESSRQVGASEDGDTILQRESLSPTESAIAINNYTKHTKAYDSYIASIATSDPRSVDQLPTDEHALAMFYGFELDDPVTVSTPVTETDGELKDKSGIFCGWCGMENKIPFVAMVKFAEWPNPIVVHPDSLADYVPSAEEIAAASKDNEIVVT